MPSPVKKINHIAIIMDGNGRWAKKKGELRIFGHTNGVGNSRFSATSFMQYILLYLYFQLKTGKDLNFFKSF